MDSLPARTDVAIIGGGLAGLATAWALAERGVRDVIVLEREDVLASHASARNAAMCRALSEDDDWTAWTAPGARFLREPPAGFTEVPLVDGRGAVLLGGLDVQAALTARARRFELRCEPMSALELGVRWPGLAVDRGGVFFPDDGNIDLAALIAGYLRCGARVVTGAAVTGFAPGADGVALTTARGPLTARTVALAAGAWTAEVAAAAGIEVAYQARRRHIVALDGAAPADAPIVWNVDGAEWYARPAGAQIWSCACDSEVVPPGDVSVQAAVEHTLRGRLPAPLSGLPVARSWACQRTFASGGIPVVARDLERPWLVWVAGLGGHGVTASAAIGRAAAAAILDQ